MMKPAEGCACQGQGWDVRWTLRLALLPACSRVHTWSQAVLLSVQLIVPELELQEEEVQEF